MGLIIERMGVIPLASFLNLKINMHALFGEPNPICKTQGFGNVKGDARKVTADAVFAKKGFLRRFLRHFAGAT